jgi:lipopolysaccharide/colanic/teichoic acid biosynthesis glycosyltransferase
VFAPVFLIVLVALALAILVFDGRPAFFSQERVGANGRRFQFLKFRTMHRDADARLAQILASDETARAEWDSFQKLAHDPRVTQLGKLLRMTSLDELPQLINVWRGEMSLVGPRPIMVDQIPLYADHFQHYCAVQPGITGLWQISGRNNKTFEERVRLDAAYSERQSLWLDLSILVRTVPVVLWSRGAY